MSRDMSICYSGIKSKTLSGVFSIKIEETHPLIELANALPWEALADTIVPDIKRTGGQWWLGRKLKLKTHLSVYLLQQLFNKTDRQIEYDVRDNVAYQLFCGRGIVKNWHCPDHTKIEAFRSRLSPETQQKLANLMASHSVTLGFGDPTDLDVDSTIQEANMSYPADSCLLKKLGSMASKVSVFFNKKVDKFIKIPIEIDLKKISHKARAHFFLSKKATKEQKDKTLKALLNVVTKEIKPVIAACKAMSLPEIERLPCHLSRTIIQIKTLASQYLKDVQTFITTGNMVLTKILSFHLKEVSCFTKRKLGKKYHFGRAFQLCRIGGNFLFATKCTSVEMSDKKALQAILEEHKQLFGSSVIHSVSTDKGYFSVSNEEYLHSQGVSDIGIQRPVNVKKPHPNPITKETEEALINRRSGIEPLLGHAKQGGQLGRSRMKSDATTESSGYAAILGFNLRQMIRHQRESKKDVA